MVSSNSFVHVSFRCHNRQFLFESRAVKIFLIFLWSKYLSKYEIEIWDFIVMDNHAHLLVRAKTADHLGNFMRTVNSQLTRFINKTFDRDSQAIRERYKSPIITNIRYLQKAMQYIWLNRYRETKARPEQDPFCSASWRLNGDVIINGLTTDPHKKSLLQKLLSPYRKLDVLFIDNERKYVRDLLNAALSSVSDIYEGLLKNSHTIGDRPDIDYRLELMKAYRRDHVPWVSN